MIEWCSEKWLFNQLSPEQTIYFSILYDKFSILYDTWETERENWSWSLLGVKGLIAQGKTLIRKPCNVTTQWSSDQLNPSVTEQLLVRRSDHLTRQDSGFTARMAIKSTDSTEIGTLVACPLDSSFTARMAIKSTDSTEIGTLVACPWAHATPQ